MNLPKRHQYPKQIKSGHETYKIVYKKNLDHYGETCPNTKTITIKEGLSPRALMRTLVHEILHVVEFSRKIKIKHKDVYALEEALTDIIMDNFL